VILVDNNSTDGSLEYISHDFSGVKGLKVVALDKNYGFALGNNKGYRYVDPSSKYAIFLNNDTEVERSWIQEIVMKMEYDPMIGAAQPKIRYMSDRTKIDAVGGIIDYHGQSFHLGRGETDLGQYDSIERIFYAQGAAIALRKSVIEEVGLFDPSFFTYYEETDLCWRVWLDGYRVALVPRAIVYHWGGATIKKMEIVDPTIVVELKTFHSLKNRLSMMLKNYSFVNVIKYVLPFGVRLFGVGFIQLAKGESIEGLARLRALWWLMSNIRKIIAKRQYVQKVIRKLPDSEIMKLMRSKTEM
jgi:hypothetical protein